MKNEQLRSKPSTSPNRKKKTIDPSKKKKTQIGKPTNRERKRETFAATELGTFKSSMRTQKFNQSSGRVDGGDLKPLPINPKNPVVVHSLFRLLHFLTAIQQITGSFISPPQLTVQYYQSNESNQLRRISFEI